MESQRVPVRESGCQPGGGDCRRMLEGSSRRGCPCPAVWAADEFRASPEQSRVCEANWGPVLKNPAACADLTQCLLLENEVGCHALARMIGSQVLPWKGLLMHGGGGIVRQRCCSVPVVLIGRDSY